MYNCLCIRYTARLSSCYDAWIPCVRYQVSVSAGSPQAGWPRRYIHVRRCGGLPSVPPQLKDPLEPFVNRKEFLAGSAFLSLRDRT